MVRCVVNDPRSRCLRHALLIAVLLLGAAAAQGAELQGRPVPRKPAWKWTIDERLAARFDPEAMAVREAEHQAGQEAFRQRWSGSLLLEDEVKMTGPPAATETLDGSKTPELFLPVELFGTLLRRGLPPEEEREGLQTARGQIEERAAALGFGRDLWDRLEKIAAPYLRPLHNNYRRRLITRSNDDDEEVAARLCRLRAQALEAAKAEFGEEAFLRLLYEAVAPSARGTYILESWPPDYQRHAEQLLSVEEGCR